MNEHKKYIHRIKRNKFFILFFQISIFITFLLLWEYAAKKGIINSFITSSPSKIHSTLLKLYKDKMLFIHIYTTLKETIIAFIITSILSLIISILLYNYKMLNNIVEPYLTILNSLPKVALGPIIIIWFGANDKSIIVMAILISLIVSVQSIKNGFVNTDKLKIKLMNTFKANKKDVLKYLIIPGNIQTILNTLKINISMCLIGVISGEFLTSKAGIGYLILYGSQIFNLDLVMSGIFLLTIISFILYKLILLIKK